MYASMKYAISVLNYYMKQSCHIVDLSLRDRLQRNFNQTEYFSLKSIREGRLQNAAISFRPHSFEDLTFWNHEMNDTVIFNIFMYYLFYLLKSASDTTMRMTIR